MGKTRDLAGKKAGFGSGKQFERAKSVVEKAAPEVVEAMDKGVVSIRAAATIAKKTPLDKQGRSQSTLTVIRR